MKPNFISIGAACAALGILLGAFGAHALRGRIGPAELAIWETATRYLLVGALGTLLFGLYRQAGPEGSAAPGFLLLAGSVLFAASLYGLALGAPRFLGAITPLGGIALVAGFVCFALGAGRRP